MLSKPLRDQYVSVLRFTSNQMKEDPNPAVAMYYFSTVSAESSRVLNLEWDANVALIFNTATTAYNEINARFSSGHPLTPIMPPPPDIVIRLTGVLDDLIDWISDPDASQGELTSILGEMATLTYSVTGNGEYLRKRGILELG